MASVRLTKSSADAAKAKAKPYQLHDEQLPGLILRIQPTCHKSWYFEYRLPNGVRKRMRLGLYSRLSVDGARTLAKTAAGQVATGVDVQARKQDTRAEADRAKAATLGSFLRTKYAAWAKQHLRCGDVAVARLEADFEKWLDDPMTMFNVWRLESWRRDRLAAKVKATSINRQLDTLRSCLRKAVAWGVLDTDPMVGLKRLKTDDDERVRFLSQAEEKRLRTALVTRETKLRAARDRFNDWRTERKLRALPARTAEYVDHLRPLVLVALNTGLRRGELFSLRWADIDFESNILTVRAAGTKSGNSRRLPLNTEAANTLAAWKKQRASKQADLVFPSAKATERLTNINKAWATVRTLAELEGFRFHDCRHHFASMLVQKGVDLNTVRELLGHASLEMTLRYSHLRPDNLSAAVAKLATR